MKILVTGSNGYIGLHICNFFRKNENYIIGVGRKKNPRCTVDEYVQCDFGNDDVKSRLRNVFEKGIDVLLHIAADNRREPYGVDVVKSNCIGTQALLELSDEYRVKVFIQLSSIPVIGTPRNLPITPQHSLEPPTVYHATKCLQELLADYAYRSTGLRTVSIRIPSPMGPGVNPRYIFPTFIRQALAGEDINLYGKGTRKQTYVHVSDICKALQQAIDSEAQGVYVLGSPCLISNYNLAQRIIEVLKASSKIVFIDKPDPYDEQCWEIDYSPMQRDMGYAPQVTLEEMIIEYGEYLKNNGEVKLR